MTEPVYVMWVFIDDEWVYKFDGFDYDALKAEFKTYCYERANLWEFDDRFNWIENEIEYWIEKDSVEIERGCVNLEKYRYDTPDGIMYDLFVPYAQKVL